MKEKLTEFIHYEEVDGKIEKHLIRMHHPVWGVKTIYDLRRGSWTKEMEMTEQDVEDCDVEYVPFYWRKISNVKQK